VVVVGCCVKKRGDGEGKDKERGERTLAWHRLLNLKAHPLVTHFLQQDHTYFNKATLIVPLL
ncbi:hypothetical protein ACQP3J_28230, partial [Escherichia coli]